MNKPTQCYLWQKENLTSSDLALKPNFELICTYARDNHFSRTLLQCRECQQIYFHEFREEIDWVNGNDPQYRIFIPLESKEEVETKRLLEMSQFEILKPLPQLRSDWPADKEGPVIHWVGRK